MEPEEFDRQFLGWLDKESAKPSHFDKCRTSLKDLVQQPRTRITMNLEGRRGSSRSIRNTSIRESLEFMAERFGEGK